MGRKAKFDEETVTFGFRVPRSQLSLYKNKVNDIIDFVNNIEKSHEQISNLKNAVKHYQKKYLELEEKLKTRQQ